MILRAMVQGTIRGARTVELILLVMTYETVLEVDREIMLLLLREAEVLRPNFE